MDYNEIIDKMNSLDISKEDFANNHHRLSKNFGPVPLIEESNDEETNNRYGYNSSQLCYIIRHFVDHDVYVKLEFYSSSYDKADYESGTYSQVFPKTKTITYFE